MLDRFAIKYPTGFLVEAVSHYRLLSSGAYSRGRETEDSSLYNSAAYLTSLKNPSSTSAQASRRSNKPSPEIQPAPRTSSNRSGGNFRTPRLYILQRSSSPRLGTRSCADSRESGVSYPALFEACIDAPAAYSSAGSQYYHRQKNKAIRTAATDARQR